MGFFNNLIEFFWKKKKPQISSVTILNNLIQIITDLKEIFDKSINEINISNSKLNNKLKDLRKIKDFNELKDLQTFQTVLNYLSQSTSELHDFLFQKLDPKLRGLDPIIIERIDKNVNKNEYRKIITDLSQYVNKFTDQYNNYKDSFTRATLFLDHISHGFHHKKYDIHSSYDITYRLNVMQEYLTLFYFSIGDKRK